MKMKVSQSEWAKGADKLNPIRRVLLILYVATVWISVVFFTPHITTVRSGAVSYNVMKFYPIWGGDEELKTLMRIDYGFIWIEIAMISISFISLILAFQGKTKSTQGKPNQQIQAIENGGAHKGSSKIKKDR